MLVLATVVTVATAIWLIPASIHIVGWRPSGAIRVALFAPWPRWWVSLVAVTAVAAVVALAERRSARAFRRGPLLWLGLWIIPYLPWLPDRAPVLLVLAGPLRWVVAACAVLAAVRPWTSVPRSAVARLSALTSRRVFVMSLVIYLILGFRFASVFGFGGDEPHYLIITQSLLADRDLDIANNHAQRDYRAFFPGELRPDYLRRGVHGEIYSIHAPGLPALLLPGYAVAGARGAVATMAVMGALTATAVFALAAAIAGQVTGVLVWAAVCLTVPFVPHAWLIYPELPGALIVAWALLWVWRGACERRADGESTIRLLTRGGVLAILPWLHTKFVVLLTLFALFEMIRIWPRVKALAAFLFPIALSIVVWLALFYKMYGVLDPEAPYGSYTQLHVLSQNIPRGALGLLFDQKFGLLMFSPVYVLAAAGLWMMSRQPTSRAFAAWVTLTIVAFLATTTRLYMWWGGSSAPARFLVPVLPLLAPMLAVAFERLREGIGRIVLATTLAVSLAISVVSVALPEQMFLFSDPHGFARLVQALQGSAPLDVSLPTFTDENWQTPAWLLLRWLASLAVGFTLVGAWLLQRGRRFGYSHAASALLLATVVGGVMTNSSRSSSRGAVTTRGQLLLMETYEGDRQWAFGYDKYRRLNADEVLAASALSLQPDSDRLSGAQSQILAGPFTVPAGRYEARLWFEGDRPRYGEAFASVTSEVRLAEARDPFTNPVTLSFDVPLHTPVSVGVSSSDLARDVTRVELAPTSIIPRRGSPGSIVGHSVEPIEGSKGYIVYADDHTFPEHGVYWTRDTDQGVIYVVPRGASTLTLILRVGPNAGPVEIRVGDDGGSELRNDVNLGRDEIREVTIPIREHTPLVRIAVRASSSFRPAEFDPQSDDQRLLGCQVRPKLR